ncbi:hypothetical protein L1987_64241 [Smallanthus sonchifolius]|uniref:Uncharacterized protein n=1 Tax=Smallanthus sonchifolius TaxID=185202 RepID=A0ACB9CFH8_9ASTR|nr:hypothetical protein L1987_64241 [Smallanthus sonchifolius]
MPASILSESVEVDCRGRIRGVDIRPQTRSDDSNVGETNWSGAFAHVGTTRSGRPSSAVEVQGTGVLRSRRKMAWTAGQWGRRSETRIGICQLWSLEFDFDLK